MSDTVYSQMKQLLHGVDQQLSTGGEFNLRGLMLPHYPVKDTGVAACLATFGVPFRDPGPYSDAVELTEGGDEKGRITVWWLGDIVQGGTEDNQKTEWLLGAWIKRQEFEKDHPLHAFVAMRAALDARSLWCQRIAAWRAGAAILPIEHRGECFVTDKIHSASILEACGYRPLAFNGRAFALATHHSGVHAEQLLIEAAQKEGATPPMWMARVLFNYSHLVKIAKAQTVIIQQPFDDQTLLLSADVEKKTRDKFMKLV